MFIQVFNLKGFNYLWLLRADTTDRLYVNKAGDKLWTKALDVRTGFNNLWTMRTILFKLSVCVYVQAVA